LAQVNSSIFGLRKKQHHGSQEGEEEGGRSDPARSVTQG